MTFEEFAERHSLAMLKLAYSLTGDRHLAEDLVQSALANAYRHWRRVSTAQNPEAYVRKIVVNTHLSWRRRLWTTERPLDADERTWGTTPDFAEDAAEYRALREQVACLSRRARTVVVLRYWGDLDDRAIAEVMGISQSTVRSTAARALAALRGANTLARKDSDGH